MPWSTLHHQWKEALVVAISTCTPTSTHLRCLLARIITSGIVSSLYLSATLISRYLSFHDLSASLNLFHSLRPKPTKTLLWNTLIRCCLTHNRSKLAIDLYHLMVTRSSPDHRTYHLVIAACTDLNEFEIGREVAKDARSSGYESDLLVGTSLVNFHCRCGDLPGARKVFDEMPVRDTVCWNSMIGGYCREGLVYEALGLFREMKCGVDFGPTEATFTTMASACGEMGLIELGMIFHELVVKMGFNSHIFVSNSLMQMYADFGLLDCVGRLFEGMVIKDAVSWSTIIGGYVRCGYSVIALKLFHKMVRGAEIYPSRPVLLNVLLACADRREWEIGKFVEQKYLGSGWKKCGLDARLVTCLVYMYAKCGFIREALQILVCTRTVSDDVVAWNALIRACSEVGRTGAALHLTLKLLRRGIRPDITTFLILLLLFGNPCPMMIFGMELHTFILKSGVDKETVVANALINMYAKSGSVEDSYRVFHGIQVKNVISWSSMIKCYAWNGDVDKALNLFQLMRKTSIKPNVVTFHALLTACSHAGYVEVGRHLFMCMKEFGFQPSVEIYGCMIDLLCRAGLLQEVQGLLEDCVLDHRSKIFVWGSLLNACRLYGNHEVGEMAAGKLFLLEPENIGNYKALAEIYIMSRLIEDAKAILRSLNENKDEGNIAFSLLEVC